MASFSSSLTFNFCSSIYGTQESDGVRCMVLGDSTFKNEIWSYKKRQKTFSDISETTWLTFSIVLNRFFFNQQHELFLTLTYSLWAG